MDTPEKGAPARLKALERELLAHARTAAGSRRERQLMRLAERLAADEALRLQALRFVDVLPVLDSDAAVAEHLCSHFAGIREPLPAVIRWAMRHARTRPLPQLLAPAVRQGVQWIGSRFIAGETARHAVRAITGLHRSGRGFSLDLLGEEVLSGVEAEQYRSRYLELIGELSGPLRQLGVPLHLSLKISSLYAPINPLAPEASAEHVRTRLRPILRAVMACGGGLTLDMEHYDSKEITLAVLRGLLDEDEFRGFSGCGVAMQAYLKDCEHDLGELIAWAGRRGTPIHVRLVRGAYLEREIAVARQHGWDVPVWESKDACDRSYARCLQMLVEHHADVRPAIATHNVQSLALALHLIGERDVPTGAYEFQMLYGMAENLQAALVDMGQPLRVYTPVGAIVPGMAYLVRRLLENSSNSSLLRHALLSGQPAEELLPEPPVPAPAAAFANEPTWRFCEAGERQAVSGAIGAARAELGGHAAIVINGRAVDTEERIISVNPARPDEIIGTAASATPELVDAAVAAATAALPAWAALPASERAAILRRAAALLSERRAGFVALEVLEAAKPWAEADADVCEAIDFLRYYADQAERLAAGADFDVAGESNRYEYRPCGVAAVIPPWNFPLAIPTGMTAAALVSGNTVILKPSSETPMIAARLVELLAAAGLPAGALGYLPGSGERVGEYLVAHAGVHLIAFTGSLDVGLRIQELAAGQARRHGHIKRLITEMGGKNAIIVDDDADTDAAVAGIIASAFGYAGQKCSACSRVIVVGAGHDDLAGRLRAAADSLPAGAPERPEMLLGPVISAAARQRIRGAIEQARWRARPLLVKDIGDADGGFYVGPALFTDVAPGDALAQEEIFGPVLAILRAADFDEAIRIANHSRYALTGGLYSRNPVHLQRARRDLQVGNLYLNRAITGAIVSRQPFGGFKLSGIGHKAGGPDYLLQFVQARSISENTMRRGFAPSGEKK